MQKPVGYPQIAWHLLQAQGVWTLWYVGIMLLVSIIRLIFFGQQIDTFYNQSFVASNVYMLVIGIITINFLPYYVENGITRKNYFYGNLFTSIALSILIPIFSYILSLFENLLLANFIEPALKDVTVEETNFIGDFLQSVLLAPYIDVESNLLLSFFVFSFNIFIFYIIGWLIGAAFYRLRVLGGLLFIAIGIVFIATKDSMQRILMDLPLFKSFTVFEQVPESIALILLAVLIAITIILIRLLTKRAPVKV